jgi:hypothetical protein
MFTTEKLVVRLYVDKACTEHWIVKDQEGRFWMVRPGPDSWERRQPYQPTEDSDLEPIPGHYRYMLGLPV